MICPNCQTESKNVSVKSLNSGFVINLDQCPKCGGIWFDKYELYQVPTDEAERIDKADKTLLDKLVPVNNVLLCPKDRTKLNRLVDINIPRNVQIFRCDKCDGAWLNKGELTKFDEESKGKELHVKPKVEKILYEHKSYDEIKKILEKKMGKSAYTNTIAKMSAYLYGPITDTGVNFTLPDHDLEEQSILSPEEKEQIAMTPPRERDKLYENFINYRKGDMEYKLKESAKNTLSSISSVAEFLFKDEPYYDNTYKF